MKVKLYKILNSEAKIIPGINGPYNNPETNVRNNAHWAIIFMGPGKTKKAKDCFTVLLSRKSRPFGYTFFMRKGKDKCNGLIGQAWVIEALALGCKQFKERKFCDLASKVFLLHKQTKWGYWKRREINGKLLSIDKTFNHQLWFAAAGSMISNSNEEIKRQVKFFMDNLEKNISIHKNGLIRHLIWPKLTTPIHLFRIRKTRKYLYKKEAGYHAFNLYALAILKEKFPKHSFWDSEKFGKILNYALSDEHLNLAEKSIHGFPYNPSGIELAYFVWVFRNRIKNYKYIMKESLERQFSRHLDKKTLLMSRNTNDPNTLSARIYEATRLPNLELSLK